MSLTEALRSLRTQNAPEPLSSSRTWGSSANGPVYGSGNIGVGDAGTSSGFWSGSVGGWFSNARNSMQGFMPLGDSGTSSGSEGGEWFNLTLFQRYAAFFFCMITGFFCFLLAFFTLPMLVLAPQKFATAFTLGSLLLMVGFAFLKGLKAHVYHLCSLARLPFTFTYFGSMALTLYFTVGNPSYLGTILSSVVQIVALVWYFVSYFPGGTNSLRFATSNLTRSATTLLPL
ncbi:protein transport protein sft2 [Dispira simplex]|nr:protein transport protein sft2 [Dispira simplex]